jgi:multidrug resistance efflux pump
MDTSPQRKDIPPSSTPAPLPVRASIAAFNPDHRPAPALMAARVLDLQATVLTHDTFEASAAAFAGEVATLLRYDRVAIGFTQGAHTKVVAVSHTVDLPAGTELLDAFAAAMEESLDQSSTIVLPAEAGARPLITLAHAELSRRYGGAVCTVPLVRGGRIFGALTLARAEGERPARDEIALCEHIACMIGPVLELKREGERPWHSRLSRAVRNLAKQIAAPGHTGRKAAAVVAVVALLAIFFVPVQYRIGAQARIEGSVQRALIAPSDGFLRQIHVRPGDRVTVDQVLAELAEEDLGSEKRKWQSELTQHENAASAALARSDRAQYVINQSKADEARAQLDLVERQLGRTRVVAPFDGVVIKGDLSQSLGAPLRRGDVLLTIAPADRFRLLIEVDERDIAEVAPGQQGSVALGALTERALPFRVARVTPVATARDGRNFFEVEAELNEPAPLRPGLRGVAKIDAGTSSIAWAWTHRFFDWVRFALWSWGV